MPQMFRSLFAVAVLAAISSNAAALSRRDQASVDALNQRMQAAEARYRDAMVMIGNADPEGQKQSDAALEDMEDVIAQCMKQRGCSVPTMLTAYKRLLKLNADAEADVPEGEDEGDDHASPLAADVPEAARAAHLLADDHRFDKMVQFNPAVQAGIRRWLTDMRGPLISSYENYQYMRHLMWPQYERAGLPEALLFGIMAKESNGKVHSTSRAGAAGPMQFMYATGRRFGLGDDGTGFDTRYDPRSAAEASAEYLNERMGQLNRSIELALAAYNGGEGRALRVYQGSGGRNFWEADVYNQFPSETQDYVPMVIAAAWLFLHPREYGLSFPRVDAKPAPLRLAQPSSIYQLTICLGNRGERDGYMRALRNLNPRYKAESWLPAGTTLNATTRIVGLYNRWCTTGARAELARTLVLSDPTTAIVRMGPVTTVDMGAEAASQEDEATDTTAREQAKPAKPSKPKRPRDYRVQRGETLTAIAQKFQCDTGDLAKVNKIKGPRFAIRPGQKLKLDGCGE
ncbi:transglycosylase SLT domain-containing protein [Lysobacter solisilvae (ex Woo and Kim 2020)]|uniref:Transglycosylase SLT domain-containing protein n=1 Tax=Agrilutibacter terrestris TaxID=2865112 RepID=A0A7H0FWF4_9GAMM|nr:transglycosylase SLT domain-containing protein [Lysobacter terrestris]QNP40370.1 transglycosylase SLT domain-containing protein [Lysobacter terrestris]